MLSFEIQLTHCRYFLKLGDIVEESVEAIVNAANPQLAGGGGVDGAIHRAAGPQLLEYCQEIIREKGPLPTGKAVLTPGANLLAKYVVHTVGPIWKGGLEGEDELLQSCYQEVLKLARTHTIVSLAFPSVSTGVYGFPVAKAAHTAQKTLFELIPSTPTSEMGFVLFDEQTYQTYLLAAKNLLHIS